MTPCTQKPRLGHTEAKYYSNLQTLQEAIASSPPPTPSLRQLLRIVTITVKPDVDTTITSLTSLISLQRAVCGG